MGNLSKLVVKHLKNIITEWKIKLAKYENINNLKEITFEEHGK